MGEVQLLLDDFRQLREASLGELEVLGAEAFLGTVDACAAFWTKQSILHIDRHAYFVEPFPLFRRLYQCQIAEFAPACDFLVMQTKELPTQATRQPEPGVVSGAATDPNEAPARAMVEGSLQHRGEPFGVEFKRVVFTGGQQGETDDAGGFNDRCL